AGAGRESICFAGARGIPWHYPGLDPAGSTAGSAYRAPKIAVPTRTSVAPWAIAISKSADMPIDNVVNLRLGAGVDLDQQLWLAVFFRHRGGERLGQPRTVQRLDRVRQPHRVAGLVG